LRVVLAAAGGPIIGRRSRPLRFGRLLFPDLIMYPSSTWLWRRISTHDVGDDLRSVYGALTEFRRDGAGRKPLKS